MRFHVTVTPDADEPERLTPRDVADGVGWLRGHEADGTLTAVEEWEQPDGTVTGGYMIADVPDRAALDDLLATYPLRHTVTMEVHRLAARNEGFDALAVKVAQAQGAT
jgi:muconolactone delta-isomerase